MQEQEIIDVKKIRRHGPENHFFFYPAGTYVPYEFGEMEEVFL